MKKEISKEDRAYFAGLLDGEGCIAVNKTTSNKNISYSLTVSFNITYKEVLIEMQSVFGGNIYIINMERVKNSKYSKKLEEFCNNKPENWKQRYIYNLHGRDALLFLKVVEPHCREKKEQAALGIRYEEGKRSYSGNGGRSKLETERCEFFYKELRRLKSEKIVENEIGDDFEDNQKNIFSFVDEV